MDGPVGVEAAPPSAGRILVLGFGNPGRADDGLGPALVARLEADARVRAWAARGLGTDAAYQLAVEDAEALARHEAVIFVDAHLRCAPPFVFERVRPVPNVAFSSHAMGPAGVLALARDLFDAPTRGYLLGIRGVDFDRFHEGLSSVAASHLEAAWGFLSVLLERALGRGDRAGLWACLNEAASGTRGGSSSEVLEPGITPSQGPSQVPGDGRHTGSRSQEGGEP